LLGKALALPSLRISFIQRPAANDSRPPGVVNHAHEGYEAKATGAGKREK